MWPARRGRQPAAATGHPATRFGASAGYKAGAWRAGLSLVHARAQERLADFETSATAGYNQINANLSYNQNLAGQEVSWFLLAKNLCNDEIRVSTSVLKDISPLPGRSVVFGARTKF